MRRGFQLLVLALALLSIAVTVTPSASADFEILVTSHGDSVAGGESECPSPTLCTLRRAIEAANAIDGEDLVVIRFDEVVFASDAAATIHVLDSPLPTITRSNVLIDAREAAVVVDGRDLVGPPGADGIDVQAHGFALYGLVVQSFPDICINVHGDGTVVGGSREAGKANRVDGCDRGVVVRGADATIQGNLVGLAPQPLSQPMTAGIEALDGSALVGVSATEDEGNTVGNAVTGIAFGSSPGEAMTGTIRGNLIGSTAASVASPVTTGVEITYGAESVLVVGNRITNAETGISILDDDGPPTMRNTLRGNLFASIEQIAIDLGGDGPTPNDPVTPGGDGANGLLSYPEIEEALPAAVRGTVPGPCVGCTVDFYVAERRFGELPDAPLAPVDGATVVTDAEGSFFLPSPSIPPGTYLMAIATDAVGNTSEFSPSIRLSAGSVQCGNPTLQPGWNAAGFFGASTLLGDRFPADEPSPGPVSSIHRLKAGTRDFDSWYAGGAGFGTLTTLSTGEPYWFYATAPVEIGGTLTLADSLPIDLEEGWNDFVYIGANDFVQTSLATIEGKWDALYRWVNDDGSGRWEAYGSPETPDWARGFDVMTPCSVYLVMMLEDATLTPPQP